MGLAPSKGMLRARTGLSPELLRGEAGAFGEAAQFGPGEVGMDPAAEAAIGAGDDVLAARAGLEPYPHAVTPVECAR
jgi:hypothetical protein